MRMFLALTIILTSTTTFGAEFRTLNFGAKCEGIAESERSLGSTIEPSGRSQQEEQVVEIRAVHLAREALVHYFCDPHHNLTAGDYEYEFNAYEPAVEYFLRIKPLLIAELGAPAIDSTSQQFAANLRPFGSKAEELSRYSLLWGFDKYSVSVGVITLDSKSSRTDVIIKYVSRKR